MATSHLLLYLNLGFLEPEAGGKHTVEAQSQESVSLHNKTRPSDTNCYLFSLLRQGLVLASQAKVTGWSRESHHAARRATAQAAIRVQELDRGQAEAAMVADAA